MRFVLDHDVAAQVCRVFVKAHHDCWRAPDHLKEDDEISVYAHEKGAVVISHDVDLARRRRRHTFGQHVRLKCGQTAAQAILTQHLADLLSLLTQNREGVFEVSQLGVAYYPPRWT